MIESEVRKLAMAIAAEHRWPWFEPVQITKRRRLFRPLLWTVRTNTEKLGCNVLITINDATGMVTKAQFGPR